MRFNVLQFLQDNNILYATTGNNIADSWVGVARCPFCGDTHEHLGINLNTASFSCWVCGAHGWIYDYIQAELGIDEKEVKRIGRPYFNIEGEFYAPPSNNRIATSTRKLVFPTLFTDLTDKYLAYLTKRGYDISIAQRYTLKCSDICDPLWKFRIIIPFFLSSTLVAWTGRTIFKDIDPRYKNISNAEAVIDIRSTLYNADALRKKSIIVEGPTDVWRIGAATAAVVGLEFTKAQMLMIKNKGVEEVTVIFDGEPTAYARSLRLAKNLSTLGVTAHVIKMDDGKDPGSLSDNDAAEIRKLCL